MPSLFSFGSAQKSRRVGAKLFRKKWLGDPNKIVQMRARITNHCQTILYVTSPNLQSLQTANGHYPRQGCGLQNAVGNSAVRYGLVHSTFRIVVGKPECFRYWHSLKGPSRQNYGKLAGYVARFIRVWKQMERTELSWLNNAWLANQTPSLIKSKTIVITVSQIITLKIHASWKTFVVVVVIHELYIL